MSLCRSASSSITATLRPQVVEAVSLLEEAAAGLPNNLEVKFNLARGLARKGDNERALEILRNLLAAKKPFTKRRDAEVLLFELEKK